MYKGRQVCSNECRVRNYSTNTTIYIVFAEQKHGAVCAELKIASSRDIFYSPVIPPERLNLSRWSRNGPCSATLGSDFNFCSTSCCRLDVSYDWPTSPETHQAEPGSVDAPFTDTARGHKGRKKGWLHARCRLRLPHLSRRCLRS